VALLNKENLKKARPGVRYFLDFHGHRHTEIAHSVQCGHTDPCLGSLLRQRSRLHGVAENAFLPLHRKFGRVAQVVARDALPDVARMEAHFASERHAATGADSRKKDVSDAFEIEKAPR
jgi:hypothetical protein